MPTSVLRGYLRDSRAPRYSLLFALPLLILYEALAAALARGPHPVTVRNGADVMVKAPFYMLAGSRGPVWFAAVLVGLCVFLVWRDVRHAGGVRPKVFLGMAAESLALGLVFGLIIGTATMQLLRPLHGGAAALALHAGGLARLGRSTDLMVSLGAGIYEELLFRVILVSALAWGGRVLLGLGPRGAGVLAALVGALVFSAFHYVGPYGDPFRLQSFVFRFLSGLAFSALYLIRGFGITAWTHALYDVSLLLH